MTTTSGMTPIIGTELAADDQIGVLDTSASLVKRMSMTELLRGFAPLIYNDRGVVAAFSIYNANDMVLLNTGLQVVFRQTTQASSTGFVSSTGVNGQPNFFTINVFQMVPAYLTGVRSGNGGSVNTLAIAAAFGHANNDGTNVKGRMVELPYGVLSFGPSSIDGSACIHIPNGCGLYGQGKYATYLSLADGSNCSMIKLKTSTGAGNPNGMFCKLADFGIDGRFSAQGTTVSDITITSGSSNIASAATNFVNGNRVTGPGIPTGTTIVSGGGTLSAVMSANAQATFTGNGVIQAVAGSCYGILVRTNPLTTLQSGDWNFDPTHLLDNIYIKNTLHTSLRFEGRGGSSVRDILIEHCQEDGIHTSFDMHFTNVNVGFTGWEGLTLAGSSITLDGVKVYNTGIEVRSTGIVNKADGLVIDGRAGIVGSISVQQPSGSCVRIKNCKGLNLQIEASQWGYKNLGSGQTALPDCFALELDNVQSSNFVITGLAEQSNTGLSPSTGRGYRLFNGTDKCSITYAHILAGTSGTLAPAESADTVRLNNKIEVNGTAIQFPGLVASATVATALPKLYSRVNTAGSNFNTGTTGLASAAILNRLELSPIYPPRAGMTVKSIQIRVLTGVATAICRAGIYTSDYSGSDVFQLLAELPATIDCSGIAVITSNFTTPLTIPADSVVWVAIVPQVALATFTTAVGNNVSSSSATPFGGYCYTTTVAGALPATITWSTSTPPGTIGTGIAVQAALLG